MHISEAIRKVVSNLPAFNHPSVGMTAKSYHSKLLDGAYICSPDRCEYDKEGACPACGKQTK